MAKHPRPVLTPSRRRVLYLLLRDGPQVGIGFGRPAADCISLGWAREIADPVSAFPKIELTDGGRSVLTAT